MVVAVLTITGIIALLFYIMHLMRPKRVKLSAKVLKVIEFNVEADSSGDNAKPPEARRALRSGSQTKALRQTGQKALPKGGETSL